ncbi:PilZ domain-containing protein [Catenovulum adriaticum]|uniref:PilZ domain-containing protein n=1 Tax=Catenovulum adriaticum TaxID=2984846 RepID=A0ABY7ALG7_9ALTE|nr:PilZ domain-containing protein [Catenovulum sp. TS8]WAJ69511.1 PilZ domain-containing protein [Catenovulum sp. TS8]
MISTTVKIDPNIQNIINKLISSYNTNQFDMRFNKLTQGLSTQKTFLIKQELARLFKPCIKTVDLSSRTQYPTAEFKWENKRFYFDEIAKRIFLVAIDKFHGKYTEGVYEAVTSSKNYQAYERLYQEEEKIKAFSVNVTELGKTTKRLEERLFCAKPVIIILNNKKQLNAMTSNISRSGCLIRVKSIDDFKLDDVIKIDFSSLTEQFRLSTSSICQYQIKFIAKKSEKDGLFRVGIQLTEDNHEWMQFLDKYVLANRASFKVDITNAKELTESRLLENQLLKCSQWLPVFAQVKDKQVKQVKYALTNLNSQPFYQFFDDSSGNNRLNSVIFKLWPQLAEQASKAHTILAAKLKNNNKVQFIAASLADLINKDALKAFIHFANLKGQLTCFQIRTQPLSQDALNQLKLNWFKSSKEAEIALEPLKLTNQLLCFYPMDHHLAYLPESNDVQLNKQILSQLNQYICPKIKNQAIAPFDVNVQCSRAENRFFLSSAVTYNFHAKNYSAKLLDISTRGLSLQVERIPNELELDQNISLRIAKLEQFNKIAAQSNAQYKVVGLNEHAQTLHLQLVDSPDVQQFMRSLIKQHRAKLKINDQYDKFIVLQKALCIAFISSYPGTAFGIAKSTTGLVNVNRLLTGQSDNQELALLKALQPTHQPHQLSVYPLLKGNASSTYLNSVLKFIRSKKVSYDELSFFVSQHKQQEQRICLSELEEDENYLTALKPLQTDKQMYNLSVSLYPVQDNGTEIIADNLKYISRSNRHQAEQIKLFAQNLTGIIELVDSHQFWQIAVKE